MLPDYKGDTYYTQFIGKYFKMDLPEGNCSCVKIIDFQNRTFIVEECSACLGSGIVRKSTRTYCFVDQNNYKEISSREYGAVHFLITGKWKD